jgi:hypothetical protein
MSDRHFEVSPALANEKKVVDVCWTKMAVQTYYVYKLPPKEASIVSEENKTRGEADLRKSVNPGQLLRDGNRPVDDGLLSLDVFHGDAVDEASAQPLKQGDLRRKAPAKIAWRRERRNSRQGQGCRDQQ